MMERPTLQKRYFNPHPPCGGRHFCKEWQNELLPISIHTLRVEGDHAAVPTWVYYENFNPHPPCGGRQLPLYALLFLVSDFNPHPPCGGRPTIDIIPEAEWVISIHTLRVEGD